MEEHILGNHEAIELACGVGWTIVKCYENGCSPHTNA